MTKKTSRRELLGGAAVAGAAYLMDLRQVRPAAKPNIVLIIADQVRSDAVGPYGANPMELTPNIDSIARAGILFRNMFTNQPVCSPSRAALFTGQYPARSGVWKNAGANFGLRQNATTLATECAKAGYSTNYIGKWHLAQLPTGPVAPQNRGGFLGLWQASNMLELTSQPYSGDIYDRDGHPIHFDNEYRVDFLTRPAKRFLQNASRSSPFLLVVSYLEPHQQNDLGHMVAPRGYAERYKNPFVPGDLQFFPGTWQAQLPDYYGALKRVDEGIGEIRSTLKQEGLAPSTIVVFVSDHGCHFMTRNTEYKRSIHDASTKVPLVMEGPGLNRGKEVGELIGMVDVMPTVLEAAGIPVPATVQGRSALPLLSGEARDWRNEIFIQLSEFWVGRGLRTPEWTLATVAPRSPDSFKPQPNAPAYASFQLYDNRADPHQLVNLAGRKESAGVEEHLRSRLSQRMQDAGDTAAELLSCPYPYA
ncbi:MAG TPA: sulfatase-like hydrolase/transferase [Bryobacteraceae bacterium]|jgi:arylsulfatase A-like enzyme